MSSALRLERSSSSKIKVERVAAARLYRSGLARSVKTTNRARATLLSKKKERESKDEPSAIEEVRESGLEDVYTHSSI